MSWTQTHRRWAVLREIAALVEREPDAALPWSTEHAELFGDRDGLVAALRYRCTLQSEAQLDPQLSQEAYDERRRELAALQAGVRRLIARHTPASIRAAVEPTRSPEVLCAIA